MGIRSIRTAAMYNETVYIAGPCGRYSSITQEIVSALVTSLTGPHFILQSPSLQADILAYVECKSYKYTENIS